MERTHARGAKGKRVVCKSPQAHWKTLSTIAALTVNGMLGHATFEGATDTDMFLEFVRTGLLPNLKRGQIVVLDNLSVHTSPGVATMIESAGAKVMYLPPYSPDFNPIEMAISKIKAYVRKLAKRTVEEVTAAIDDAMKTIGKKDAKGFFGHCGYLATCVRKAL